MKIDISKIISDALFNRSRNNSTGIAASESLFRTYSILAKINEFNLKVPRSDRYYLKTAINYYTRVLRASKKNRFIAAYSLGCPVEILYAMDIVPFQLEATGWLLSMLLGETNQLLTAANDAGLATEICSVHRLMAGSFARQMLPRPRAVLWTNMPCENSAKSGALLAKLNDCPGFFMDHPNEPAPEAEEYLVAEFKNLISFLEEKSGYRLNYYKLAEAVAQSNRQIELCRELSQLRKNVPSPFPSSTFLRVFMINLLFAGQTEGTAYLEILRNELAEKVRQGKGTLPLERFRLINLNLPPLYFMGSLEKIFQEHGAIEVVNPFFLEWQDGTLDPTQPLLSLAKKSLMNPVMRVYGFSSQPMLDALKQNISEYKIDGAVNYAHIGCASFGGISRVVRDTLRAEGVPVLDLACDITDPTVSSPEEMREQLVRFFEQLEDR